MVPVIRGFFLVLSVFVFGTLSFFIQYRDLRNTYTLAVETASFLENACHKYDNYALGDTAKSMQDILDKALLLKNFIPFSRLTESDFLKDFIQTEHLGGVLVLDSELLPLAWADMDHKDSYSMWKNMVSKDTIKNIFQYPEKTYSDFAIVDNVPYNFVVISCNHDENLLLCYESTNKPTKDLYEFSIESVLRNNNFHKNPLVVITDGVKILSANLDGLVGLPADQYQIQNSGEVVWKQNQLTHFKCENTSWYGLRHVYGSYYIYVVYVSNEVFSDRTNFWVVGMMIYLAVSVVILCIQKNMDKRHLRDMQKQFNTIHAISTVYTSTMLLHLDEMLLESIKISGHLKEMYEKNPDPREFLAAICRECIDQEYQKSVMEFFEPDTFEERLRNHTYLGEEVRDVHGRWYSTMLIPQSYDADNRVRHIIIATMDVTAIKETEELSFCDKLTGLYNRNYMELKGRQFVRSGRLPISFIMADCNYLKKVNDTLGHEYGDLLLKRAAKIIRETIPENGVAIRVGGDEFLALCPECSREAAEQLVSKIRSQFARESEEKLPLSAAFGVYTAKEQGFSFEEAYYFVDQAMYRDKKASREENQEKG